MLFLDIEKSYTCSCTFKPLQLDFTLFWGWVRPMCDLYCNLLLKFTQKAGLHISCRPVVVLISKGTKNLVDVLRTDSNVLWPYLVQRRSYIFYECSSQQTTVLLCDGARSACRKYQSFYNSIRSDHIYRYLYFQSNIKCFKFSIFSSRSVNIKPISWSKGDNLSALNHGYFIRIF